MPRPLPAVVALALGVAIGACSASSTEAPSSEPSPSEVSEESSPEVAPAEPPSAPTRTLRFDGPAPGSALSAEEAAALTFVVRATAADGSIREIGDLRIRHDGDDVTHEAEVDPGQLTYAPSQLREGDHLVEVTSTRPDPGVDTDRPADGEGDPGSTATGGDRRDPSSGADGDADGAAAARVLQRWSFTVDTADPEIRMTSPSGAVIADEPVTVTGRTEPGVTVSMPGTSTQAGDDGTFALELAGATSATLPLLATDPAGNVGGAEVTLLTVPSRVEIDEIRSVHVSFCAWATPALRDPVLEMVDRGLINAVQLDLKDETGTIGFETGIELAGRAGADEPPCGIDLAAAVEQLHGLGVAVIGRIVAFADPVLAPWAWEHDRRDWVVQTPDEQIYTGRYEGFTNVASDEVVTYNLDIAEEAAAAGVDHILWDYIRRPDGPEDGFRFPGLQGEPAEAIVEFTRLADERLAPYGVEHGASVYGISADRPSEVAQDIPAMAAHLDYVAPMLYPSHWGPGEYGIPDPLHAPYDTIHRTLDVWLEATDGARARVVPWLEDSNWPVSLGYPDRARYVEEQIEATYDRGIDEWLLWDSAVRYTDEAITAPPEE